MKGPIVVDVGNTRIKWGRCDGARVVEVATFAADAPDAWQRQLDMWPDARDTRWVLSGVQPDRRHALAGWLHERGMRVDALDSYRQLPLAVKVDAPASVGMDRLLNAVAANTRRPEGQAAAIVDAGTAVTVDLVDDAGRFRGGAILPGLRLMARSLHEHTALLPLVEVVNVSTPPATLTTPAIRAGIFHAVTGGIQSLLAAYARQWPDGMLVFYTGGDGAIVSTAGPAGVDWPEMTLEGILRSWLTSRASPV